MTGIILALPSPPPEPKPSGGFPIHLNIPADAFVKIIPAPTDTPTERRWDYEYGTVLPPMKATA